MRKEKLTGEEFKRLFEDDAADPAAWEDSDRETTEKEPAQIAPPAEPVDAEAVEAIVVDPPEPEEE